MFDPKKRSWTIIDWKTDKVSEDKIEAFVENYRPQITAYLQAVSEITQCPVKSGIFSTVIGKWMMV